MVLGAPLSSITWLAVALTLLACTAFIAVYPWIFAGLEVIPLMDRLFFLLGATVDESMPETQRIRQENSQVFLTVFLIEYSYFAYRSKGGKLFFVFFIIPTFTLSIGYRGGLFTSLSVPYVPPPISRYLTYKSKCC